MSLIGIGLPAITLIGTTAEETAAADPELEGLRYASFASGKPRNVGGRESLFMYVNQP